MMPANIFFAKHPQTWAKSSNLHIAPLTALVQTVNTLCNLDNLDSPSLLSPSMWDCLSYKGVVVPAQLVMKSPPPYVTRRTLTPSERSKCTKLTKLTTLSSKLQKTPHAQPVKPMRNLSKVHSYLNVQKAQKITQKKQESYSKPAKPKAQKKLQTKQQSSSKTNKLSKQVVLKPRESTCIHGSPLCCICHPEKYIKHRITRCVLNGLKRLKQAKISTEYFVDETENVDKKVLKVLGVKNWDQVITFLENKRRHWNSKHGHKPTAYMGLMNIDYDHIRPVDKFVHEKNATDIKFCNHYTNLQPLLSQDNGLKANKWSREDESKYRSIILCNTSYQEIYYPAGVIQPSLLEADNMKER